jgi:hypothetical protein
MRLSVRLRWNAATTGVLLLILAAGVIAAATRASWIVALLSIAFALGILVTIGVDRYIAGLIHALRIAASALSAASARVVNSPELSAYLTSRAERLQRILERFDGVRASKAVRVKDAIPFVPRRFPSGSAISDK